MYRAIGKYDINATDEEKIAALNECIVAAAIELVNRGVSVLAVEDVLETAMMAAEVEWDNLRANAENDEEVVLGD